LKSELSDTKVLLSWKPVTRYTDLDEVVLTKYLVYRSASGLGGYSTLTELDSSTVACTDSSPLTDSFYKITAVDNMDNTSGYSVVVDNHNNVYAYRVDVDDSSDSLTSLTIPSEAKSVLYQGGDYDRHIEIVSVADDAGKKETIKGTRGTIAASFSFDAYRFGGRTRELSLEFPSQVQITLMYEVDANGLIKNTSIPANTANEKLGLYYFNGLEWIKLPGTINETNHTLTVSVNHLSKYALIAGVKNAIVLTLVKRVPSIFTPNGDQVNDYVFFYYDGYSGKQISGKIFDLSGALMKEMSEVVPGQMKWDGKDAAGKVMESGVYVYQIQAGDEIINGSVVLAK